MDVVQYPQVHGRHRHQQVDNYDYGCRYEWKNLNCSRIRTATTTTQCDILNLECLQIDTLIGEDEINQTSGFAITKSGIMLRQFWIIETMDGMSISRSIIVWNK